MENRKSMTPLFYKGNFNREGRRMRVVLEKEISDGTQTYRLWRAAGKPDRDYACADNDKYILYVKINGYLLPLGMTECYLVNHCGFEPAAEELYGGKENRAKEINTLQKAGGSDAVSAALAEEAAEIKRLGSEPARQTEYIHSLLAERVDTYLEAKENGGQTFPDFAGALVMNDLSRCMELSAAYRTKREADGAARQARTAEKDKAYCEEQNRAAEQAVSAAIQIIRKGGVLKNTSITVYQSRYSARSYSIVNHLMRVYQVDVPLRTQGWINEKLVSATIRDGRCENLQYYRGKSGRCSQKFFECMDDLIRAIVDEVEHGAGGK